MHTSEESAPVAHEDVAATQLGVLGDLVGYHMRPASAVIANDFNRAIADA